MIKNICFLLLFIHIFKHLMFIHYLMAELTLIILYRDLFLVIGGVITLF